MTEPTMNPVQWFEIPATDLARAKAFYESALEIELTDGEMGPAKMAFFPMAQGVPGAAGTLIKADGYTPSHRGTMVYFTVGDIDGTLARIGDNAGKTLTPKTSIGEYGFIALFEDCEGNRVGLHSMS